MVRAFSLAGHWPTHTPQPVQSRTEMAMWNPKPFWARQGRHSMEAGAAAASSALSRRGRMAAWGQAKAHLLHWTHFSASHTGTMMAAPRFSKAVMPTGHVPSS